MLYSIIKFQLEKNVVVLQHMYRIMPDKFMVEHKA